jgi:hypothetical protein
MPHPLEQKIGKVRSRVRRRVIVYGLSCVVAVGLAAVMVLGLADYVVRFQDPGLRVILSLLLLGVLGWSGYRYLYLGLCVRASDVDLAQRVQRRFPALGDYLASAVEFLGQPADEPTAGSAALRRAVIAETTARSETLDFSDALRRGPTFRAVVGAAAVGLLAATVALLDPLSSQVALARLAWPLGQTAWPRKTHLELVEQVDRVARGQAFEVKVVDALGAKLPSNVRIHYRFEGPDASVSEETRRMRPLEKSTMVARRENVTGAFSYRIRGGDDYSMEWIPVELVEPPDIRSAAIKLIPPAYTGWPAESGQAQERHLRALVGTRVEIRAEATKPLSRAAVCLDAGQTVPGRVSDDGLHFVVPGEAGQELVVERSGTYWFELTDREGMHGGTDARWEIHAVPDRPPTVSIERPGGTIFVTPRAAVPLRVAAKDDLAIHRIAIVVEGLAADGTSATTGGAPGADVPSAAKRVIPLYNGPARVGATAGLSSSAGNTVGQANRDTRVVDYRWELTPLGLTPGTQLTFHVTATDYLPQTGKSERRRLAIITPEELSDRIAGRQSFILAELARVLKMQRQSRDQVAKLEVRWRERGQLDTLDVDHLRGAELNQRQASRTLGSRTDGAAAHILGLLADLENNKVDNPDIRRRMHAVLDEIDRLGREHMPVIARELTAAIKAAQVHLEDNPVPNPGDATPGLSERDAATDVTTGATAGAASLATAGKHQDRVIASLERMLGRLAQWDHYRRFHGEIGRLLRDQGELAGRAVELGRRTLTEELKDLRPQELADLKGLRRGQLELARRLDRILQAMDRTGRELRDTDPLAADTVADALRLAGERAVSGSMRTAGDHLGRNRIGQAAGLHKRIAADLEEILDILANRRRHELARLVKRLRQAESELIELGRRQEGLNKRIRQAATDAEHHQKLRQLAPRQRELQTQAERMARRLEQLMADRAGKTTHRAAGKMDRAGKCAAAGEGNEATHRAEEAKTALDEAIEQLAGCCGRAEADLIGEQAKPGQTPGDTTSQAGGQPKPVPGGAKPSEVGDTGPGGPTSQRPDMARMRTLLQDLWGELPGRQRERMLQLPVEEFLPQYELLIEQYFKRLAEERGEGIDD